MRRLFLILLVAGFLPGLALLADGGPGNNSTSHGGGGGGSHGGGHSSHGGASSHGGHGGVSRQPQFRNPQGAIHNNYRQQFHQQHNFQGHGAVHGNFQAQGNFHSQFHLSASLQAHGVTRAPHLFGNRGQIMVATREHSMVALPHAGFGGHAIVGVGFGPHEYNNAIIRNHMNFIVHNGAFNAFAMNGMIHGEAGVGNYYWHHYNGFDYCHYNDAWGYSWFGWYVGPHYFWTRYWGNHFWIYDNGFDRWCYWSNGYWWWQNPYNLNEVYLYQNDQYVPAGVSAGYVPGRRYVSADGTCAVKIQGENNDAYLLDTRQPPVYEPFLLASGVSSVKFYEPQDASPIQIMLVMTDGSIRIFDDQGNALNFNERQAQQEEQAPEDGEEQQNSPNQQNQNNVYPNSDQSSDPSGQAPSSNAAVPSGGDSPATSSPSNPQNTAPLPSAPMNGQDGSNPQRELAPQGASSPAAQSNTGQGL